MDLARLGWRGFVLSVCVVSSLACLGIGKDDGSEDCADGFVLGEDGNCYAVDVGPTDESNDPDDPSDRDDPGPVGELAIDLIEFPDCGARWVYRAETIGRTGEALLNIYDLGSPPGQRWNEEHLLPSVGYDPDDSRDYLEVELQAVSSPGDFDPGKSTLFPCESLDYLTFAIRLYDVDGNFADCGVMGPDAQAMRNDPEADGFNPVTRPGELLDCHEFAQ